MFLQSSPKNITVCDYQKLDRDPRNKKSIFAEMEIGANPVRFQVDCGATVNILPKKYVCSNKIEKTSKVLQMWNRDKLKPEGTCRLIVKNRKTKARLTQTCQARTFCQDLARTPRTPRFFHCRQSPRCFGQTNMQMKVSWCSRGHVWDMSPTYFRGVKSLLRQS